MKPLAWACLLFAAPLSAGEPAPPASCPDPRAWRYIFNAYPSLDKPDGPAFLALPEAAQKAACAKVQEAAKSLDALAPELRKKAERVGVVYLAWLSAYSTGDDYALSLNRAALLEGVSPKEKDQPEPVWKEGSTEITLGFSEAGYVREFAQVLARFKPPVFEEKPGRDLEFILPLKETLSLLGPTARAAKLLSADQAHEGAGPVHCAFEQWQNVLKASEDAAGVREADHRGGGPTLRAQLDGAGKKIVLIRKDKNPFGPDRKPEDLAFMPGDPSLLSRPDEVPETFKDPFHLAPKGPFSQFERFKVADFKPQLRFPTRPVPSTWKPEYSGEPLDITDGTRALIDRYGDVERALQRVVEARGGDDNEVGPQARYEAWLDIQRTVGGLQDPRNLEKGEVDDRLRDFDHSLNGWAGTTHWDLLRPEEDDWWITGRTKVLGREVLGVGVTVDTLGYSAVKWFDQTFGTGVGKVAGYDFNAENASKASWGEAWHGIKGAWLGVMTTDYGAKK